MVKTGPYLSVSDARTRWCGSWPMTGHAPEGCGGGAALVLMLRLLIIRQTMWAMRDSSMEMAKRCDNKVIIIISFLYMKMKIFFLFITKLYRFLPCWSANEKLLYIN